MTPEHKEYTIAYGLHSNIPPCCIVFFLTEWEGWENKDAPYCRAVHAAPEYEYVPCPECFAYRRVNRLRLCDMDCGAEPGPYHCRERFKVGNMDEDTRRLVFRFRATMGV